MRLTHSPLRWLTAVICLGLPALAIGQNRVRFPTLSQVPTTVAPPYTNPPNTILPTQAPGQLPPNNGGVSPWIPVQGAAAPGATLGQQIQPFDPYANSGSRAPVFPSAPTIPGTATPGMAVPGTTYAPPGGTTYGPPGGMTYVPPNIVGPSPGGWQPVVPPPNTVPVPNWQVPGSVPPPPLNGVPGVGLPATPMTPVVPAPVFPEGLPWRGQETLFQDTGFLYTYLYGQDGNELQMHEAEVFTSAVFKNFAHSPNGLRVTPGFIFHFLDGPNVPGQIALPSKLYSGYIDALWQPQITPQFSADLNVRVGVFSDFQAFSSQSLRYPSRALGVVQVTPTTAFKLGVEYIDRLDYKLFPAGGILWTPNEQTRFDIYFPRPKLAQYLTCRGNTEIWWYVGAEYGGGSWTMEREPDVAVDPGGEEQIDINDIRVLLGMDWNNLDRFNGLLEIGYVFQREIVVRNHAAEGLKLDDTFMVRGGLRF